MADTENLAILLTDMVGFTERSSSQSRDAFHELLRAHDQILKDTAALYNGEWVKSTGDGMLVVFRSPTNAVQCGMAMQDALAEYNHQRADGEQIHIRVAVNLGEVRRSDDNDIFGEAVNVTARIEALTPTDEVYFTQAVYLAMNKAEVPSEPVGSKQLKGIPEPVEVFRVPAGQAVRLVAAGEPMQGAGVPYPFGGMPHASVRPYPSAESGGVSVSQKPRTWLRKLGVGIAVALLLLFVLVALNRPGKGPERMAEAPPLQGEPASATESQDHQLTVVTEPRNARVRILNIKPSYQPGMRLPSGRYHIEVSAPDHDTDTRWIELQEDQALTVQLARQTSAQHDHPAADNPDAVSDAILRRNDLFLVLSRLITNPDFFIQRHPDSAWAEGVRLAQQNGSGALRRLQQLAGQGDVEAMITLGWAHLQGKGVRRSLRDGAQWLERAYATGDPLAVWFRGMATLARQEKRGKDPDNGLRWIEQSAQRGEPLGALTLGAFYANGEHVRRDDKTAVRWLQKAVDSGLPFAESMLAGMYLEGRGVRQDTTRAVRLLQSAAGKSDPAGQHYLGMLYERGHGVKKDLQLARRYYRQAAEAGFSEAEAALKRLPVITR